jgi:hypothetical protein
MSAPSRPVTYISEEAFGQTVRVDFVATEARLCAERIAGITGIRHIEARAVDAEALIEHQKQTISAFSSLLAAIWREAALHGLIDNLNGSPNTAPGENEIADGIADITPHINPDRPAEIARDQALDARIDARRGK